MFITFWKRIFLNYLRLGTGAEVGAAAAAGGAGGAAAAGGTAAAMTAAEAAAATLLAEEAAALAGAGGLYSAAPAFSMTGALAELGLTPASLALQGAGYGVKALAAQDAAARKSKLVDALGRYQSGNAAKGMKVTNQYLEGNTPQARTDAMTAAEDANRLGFEKTVGAAQAFEDKGAPAGKLSGRYEQASANSADAASRRTKMLIENLSKMRAPGVAGATESRRFGRAASELDALGGANQSVGNAFGTDISNVESNPWANLAGNALSGVGAGLADKMKKLRAGVT